MSNDYLLSEWWWLGVLATGIVAFLSSLFLIWRVCSKRRVEPRPEIPQENGEEKYIFLDAGYALGPWKNIKRIEDETETSMTLVKYGRVKMRRNIGAVHAYEDASGKRVDDLPFYEKKNFLLIRAQTKDQIARAELALEVLRNEMQISVESVGCFTGLATRLAAFLSSTLPVWRARSKGEEKFIFVESDYLAVIFGAARKNIIRIGDETQTRIKVVSYLEKALRRNFDALRAYEDAASSCDIKAAQAERPTYFLRIRAQTKDQITLAERAIELHMCKDEMQIPLESVGCFTGETSIERISKTQQVYARITQEDGEYATVHLVGMQYRIDFAKSHMLRVIDLASRPADGENAEISVDEQSSRWSN